MLRHASIGDFPMTLYYALFSDDFINEIAKLELAKEEDLNHVFYNYTIYMIMKYFGKDIKDTSWFKSIYLIILKQNGSNWSDVLFSLFRSNELAINKKDERTVLKALIKLNL